jgi:GNAT superfamily N-acetyltransferase
VLRNIPVEKIASVKHLWRELTEYHWRCAPEVSALADPVDAETSWARRRAQYEGWSSESGWLLRGATVDGQLVGYAAARIVPAASSWSFGSTVGKLETLVVRSSHRGRGIGMLLFEHVRHHWRTFDVSHGTVSIIARNSGAQRFYERFDAVEYTRTFYFPV